MATQATPIVHASGLRAFALPLRTVSSSSRARSCRAAGRSVVLRAFRSVVKWRVGGAPVGKGWRGPRPRGG